MSRSGRVEHHRFRDLPGILERGDLLVVNRSATLAASLPAAGRLGVFRVSLSTHYGGELWVGEARWGAAQPGPLALHEGEPLTVGGLPSAYISAFPGIPRLGFFRVEGDVRAAMRRVGEPIRYGYLEGRFPLDAYQTIFAEIPGSAEMPSAGRPFSPATLAMLQAQGVEVAAITLHTGVSSLEVESGSALPPIYPEPFEVSSEAVRAVAAARARGSRVIAVGTTVVRALESSTENGLLRPTRGFTRAYVNPIRGAPSVDGLLTGLHDPRSTHLAMLEAFLDRDRLAAAYREALDHRYLWHEFGDSHLLLRR